MGASVEPQRRCGSQLSAWSVGLRNEAMNRIEDLTARLDAIGRGPRTTESRRELEEALHSKWEGVQVVAGRILADWGGSASVAAIREWLIRSAEKDAGWSVTAEAAKALAACFDPNDALWLLDLYFDCAGRKTQHPMLHLVASLPARHVAPRVAAEAKSQARNTRLAALNLAACIDVPDRRGLFREFEDDPDKTIRSRARQELRRPTKR